MQPETRSLPQRAAHRPQSRDTPHVLLIQAGREPQPAVRPFSANSHAPTKITDTHTLIILSESFPLKTVGMHVVTKAEWFLTHWNIWMLIWILTQIDRKKHKYFNHFLKVISSISDVFPPTPTAISLINHTAPPTTTIHSELSKDNMRLEAGSSHTSQNILCLVTTTWARVRAEICPPNRGLCNNIHFKFNSAAQQQGSSNGTSIWGHSSIICTYSDRQKRMTCQLKRQGYEINRN